ncbi:MAG: hypothetical protein UV71_C0016G0018 [Microgenomates group bacterium GW2011_GWC1_43_13]|nr:MAG: hypothetical protein UV71_C0016G0018 [Microgenomates group bacterium GW2011_GWC1_43_13]OGM82627.1 MAG: hypothetical protein A2394_00400 [Candidatus Woesebacteria bacterium RIFOXYB1_FULL_42_36]
MDRMPPDFYERVREGYLKMAAEDPIRWVVIDGNKYPLDIHTELLNITEGRLIIAGFIESSLRRIER